MATPSPDFAINGGAVGAKASVSSGGSVQCILDSTVGVRSVEWSIIRTDHNTVAADWVTNWATSGSVGQQLDFDAPSQTGVACIVQCQINSGFDPVTEQPSSTMRATAKVYIPAFNGLEVATNDELSSYSTESNATHGAVALLNEGLLAGSKLPVYTVGTAPAAGTAGRMIYCSNGDAGSPCLAIDNGSDWKVVSLGATIST